MPEGKPPLSAGFLNTIQKTRRAAQNGENMLFQNGNATLSGFWNHFRDLSYTKKAMNRNLQPLAVTVAETTHRNGTMAHDVFEEFRASGKELVDKARDILEEGNVRRMIIKNNRDETLLEVPLSLGVIGVGGAFALAPIISSIAAFAFFVNDARILVERYPEGESGLNFRRSRKRNPLENELRDEEDEESKDAGGHHYGSKGKGRTRGSGKEHRRDSRHDPFEIDARFEVIR